MLRLEIRDLKLVAAVAEFSTLTRAGEHLHVSQPALSHQLTALERRVGAALFERSGRRMVPTTLGQRLIDEAREILGRVGAAERQLESFAVVPVNEVRLATECYTCYHWLSPVLAAFRQQHETTEVRIVAEATADPISALRAGTLDVAFVSRPIPGRGLKSTPLFEDELVLVVANDDPFASRRFVEPGELKDRRILSYSPPPSNFAYQDVLAPAGVSAGQIVPVALTEAIVEMVKAGFGVATLARWAVEPRLRAGEVSAVSMSPRGVWREWRVVTRSSRRAPRYIQDFVRSVKATFARPPRTDRAFTVLRTALECANQ